MDRQESKKIISEWTVFNGTTSVLFIDCVATPSPQAAVVHFFADQRFRKIDKIVNKIKIYSIAVN